MNNCLINIMRGTQYIRLKTPTVPQDKKIKKCPLFMLVNYLISSVNKCVPGWCIISLIIGFT